MPETLAYLTERHRLILFTKGEPTSRYVPAFDPSFVGLTGSKQQIEATAREFRVFFQKVDGPTPDSYTLDHSSGCFVFDPRGHVRLFVPDATEPAQIAADLKRLLG